MNITIWVQDQGLSDQATTMNVKFDAFSFDVLIALFTAIVDVQKIAGEKREHGFLYKIWFLYVRKWKKWLHTQKILKTYRVSHGVISGLDVNIACSRDIVLWNQNFGGFLLCYNTNA